MAGGGNYIPIQAGEAYNLTLELHDGEDSIPKRVFVDLRVPNQQNLEATFELPYRGNGIFQEDARTFPSDGTKEVFAYFRVLETDGTTESEIHGRCHDRYKLEATIEVDLPDVVIPKQKVITGEIRSGRITGEVRKDARLEGELRRN